MQSQKAHKIELDIDYPCPSCRRGRLMGITLTEAFGCDRCQQIFVVEKEGYMIEQLAMTSPYKRSWRWTGQQWHVVQPGINDGYLPLALMVVMVLLLVWLPVARHIPPGPYTILWAFAALMLVVLPTVMVWLTHRR